MRRRGLVVWALAACLCGTVLPACGGSAGGGAKEGSSEVAVDPSEKFVGTWKLASMESNGITVVGDFSDLIEGEGTMTITLDKGGTGSMAFGEESADLTWELTDDATVNVKAVKDEAADDASSDDEEESSLSQFDNEGVDLTYQDEALVGSWKSESDESDANVTTATFTESGSIPDAPEINIEQATDVTAIDQLAGTWKLSAMRMAGATMYGSPDALAELYGESVDTTFEIKEDGSATFMGQEVTLKAEDDGAIIDLVLYQLPVKMLGEDILVDMEPLFGVTFAMVYAK